MSVHGKRWVSHPLASGGGGGHGEEVSERVCFTLLLDTLQVVSTFYP